MDKVKKKVKSILTLELFKEILLDITDTFGSKFEYNDVEGSYIEVLLKFNKKVIAVDSGDIDIYNESIDTMIKEVNKRVAKLERKAEASIAYQRRLIEVLNDTKEFILPRLESYSNVEEVALYIDEEGFGIHVCLKEGKKKQLEVRSVPAYEIQVDGRHVR